MRKATFRGVPADDCARKLLAVVPVIMRFMRRQMRHHRCAELTVPQFRSLIFLSGHADASLSALAEHIGLSLSAASRMVQLLVDRGLMDRRAHAGDRRRISLSLTRQGRDAYRKALAATEAAMACTLKTLTPRQLGQIGLAMGMLHGVFVSHHGEHGERDHQAGRPSNGRRISK
ncbi:MAG: MarR family transcriptional regulator [Phycisphaerae bacterium]|nr:MarR family transcriptional regulator [Phycisphaerae bacterium]